MAEGLELADQVAVSPGGIDEVLVIVGAEVGVRGLGVVQQVPDDDQERVAATRALLRPRRLTMRL